MIEVRPSDRTFFCSGCCERQHESLAHVSGFCEPCIERGRNFWLETLRWPELIEIADIIWGGTPPLAEAA